MLFAVSRRPLMTRLEGESTLHPALVHPSGKVEAVGAAAAVDEDEDVEVVVGVAEDVEVELVVVATEVDEELVVEAAA